MGRPARKPGPILRYKNPPAGADKKSLGDEIKITSTLSRIGEREKALAASAKARKQKTFAVRFADAERVLDLAERFDEEPATVDRACWLYGLAYYEEWASHGGPSPFTEGLLRGKGITPPRHIPDSELHAFVRPEPFQAPPLARDLRQDEVAAEFQPPARTEVREEVESVFARPVRVGRRTVPMAGILPSGHTDNSRNDEREEPMKFPEEAERPGFYQEPQDEPLPITTAALPQAVQEALADDPHLFDDAIITRQDDPTPPEQTPPPAPQPVGEKNKGGRPKLPRCQEPGCGQTPGNYVHTQRDAEGYHGFVVP